MRENHKLTKILPIATPATGTFTGTPASNNAKLPPQTLAMLEDPQDSVIKLSQRMVYLRVR